MADRWQFEKVGMTYRCWADEIQTEFRLSHVKRSRGELTGSLRIKANLKGVKTVNGTLHAANFNVLSSSTRHALAKLLESRTPGFDMDWYDGLEWLCQGVILAEEEGEAVGEIGLDAPTPPNQRYLVEPLIMRDRPALLFGPGGVGKSLLALTCGLSVAVGREIIPGIAPALHGPVLYLDWETSRPVINDRIQAIARGHGFKPENMFYRRCIRPLANDTEELATLVAEKKIVLVIVDSAAYAMGSQGEYGDANESVLRMHEALRVIGVTSQIVDHVNKTETRQKGGTATPYGSAYKRNAVRISWEVRKAPSVSGLAINLFHDKANDGPLLPPIGISLDWSNEAITFRSVSEIVDEEDIAIASTNTATLIRDLLSDGEEMDLPNIVKTLRSERHKEATIRKTVERMEDRGELTKTDRGGYKLTRSPIKLRSLPGSRGIDA